ncbi:MAG TPA: hypothetical protein VFI90_12785, partial [Rubrobacter sp.]|nr:hypothetical protein [Rubrobacter sp.]
MGVAFHLIEYSLLGALGILTGSCYGNDPFARFFTFSMLLGALSLSSLGLFGLYGAVVAHSSKARPGPLAGAGAISSAAAAFLWLSISGYGAVHDLASRSAFSLPSSGCGTRAPSSSAMMFWFLGLLLLGKAAALQPRPRGLRVLPLALFALIAPSYELGGYFEMVGNPVTSVIVMGSPRD